MNSQKWMKGHFGTLAICIMLCNCASAGIPDSILRGLEEIGPALKRVCSSSVDDAARATGKLSGSESVIRTADEAEMKSLRPLEETLLRAVPALRRCPPQLVPAAGKIVRKLGPAFADDAVKVTGQFGDDAAVVIDKMGSRGMYYLLNNGDKVVKGFRSAGAIGKGEQYLELLAKYGDRFIRHIDSHKLLYGGGTTLAVVLSNPKPYLDAGDKTVRTVSSEAIVPVAREAVVPIVTSTLSKCIDGGVSLFQKSMDIVGTNGVLAVLILVIMMKWGVRWTLENYYSWRRLRNEFIPENQDKTSAEADIRNNVVSHTRADNSAIPKVSTSSECEEVKYEKHA
ncbi:MAG: hypothetical protein HQM09_23345 [Candidatus Riflebacteria bacterium]|nr:hypothetical protein [Candidatus Riflebacteria bacterium]